MLVCQVGNRLLAVPIAHVLETMRRQPLITLPGSPPHVSGLATIRGETIPVLDLARLLGLSDIRAERFITLQKHEHGIGTGKPAMALAVALVHGLRRVAKADLRALPSLLRDSDAELVAAITSKDADLFMVLDSVRLIALADACGSKAAQIAEEAGP